MSRKKRLLNWMIERERKFFEQCQDGTEEYIASQNRLKELEKQRAELNDQTCRVVIEGAKIIVYVGTSVFTLGQILAFEKNDAFSTIAKSWLNVFGPKKL